MAAGSVLLPGKLKVLILGSEWSSRKRGLSTINRELAVNLAKCAEADVTFFVPQCSDKEKEEALSHNIDLISAERRSGMNELEWLISPPTDLHIDVVVGHDVDLGPQAQFIRDKRHCKWIQVVHKNSEEIGMFRADPDLLSKSKMEHVDEVALCKEADLVLTVGPKLAEDFRAYLRSCKKTIFEFTPGILQDVSKVHQVPGEGNKFRVLLRGRGDKKDFSLQGCDIAAEAAALSKSHLVFVGAEGNENDIKMKFLECKISAKNLTVRSTLKKRESLNELLCEVDLAVMPARTDGFGVTGLEALSAGLPVLVSPNTGFGEALIKVPFGSHFVIDSGDACDDAQVVQEWAKMIKKVKGKDRSQRLEEFEALRNFYEKKYSWEKQSKEVIREMVKMFQDASIGCQSSTQHWTSQETEGPEDSLPVNFTLKSAIFQEGKSGDPKRLMHEMTTHFVNTTRTLGNLAKTLYDYLTKTRDLEVAHVTERSLRVTVKCKTPEVLEGLWKDYRSGNLNLEAEKRLLTDDIKREFHVVSVKLQTTIRIVDYLACKLFLTSFPQSDEYQTTDETQTQSDEEPEPVTQHADIKYSADNRGGSNQLQTKEDELETTRKQMNEQQGHEEQSTQEQNPVTKVQIQLQTEQIQLEAMAEQLKECPGEPEPGELLRQEQNRVTELQSQLRIMEKELETTRKKLSEYQEKEELWRQNSYKLQSDLRTITDELKRARAEGLRERVELPKQLQFQWVAREQDLESTRKQLYKLEIPLRTREQDLEATRGQPIEVHDRQSHFLVRARAQELETRWEPPKTFDVQGSYLLRRKHSKTKDWVIHRSEIRFDVIIAEGTWGRVSRGRFRDRDVAVKEMMESPLSGVTVRDFVEQQADMASKCHNSCLLQFIGATADHDGQPPLFLTEFMGMHCNLKTRLYQRGFPTEEPTLTEEDVTVISLDVAGALNYLHQKPLSIIHYNISIGKVLIWRRDEQWRAKVSGYETMNFVANSSGKDVRYRAPELLTNDPSQPISFKVDVYSFGVLLCEMSIRQEPDPQQRVMQIAQIRNRHFRELVQHCVIKEPEGRPNMEEVIEDLRFPPLVIVEA